MARKTQISKEVILEAAFRMLLRDGYGSVNITSLAREIGCSTQPIAWHFGSMDGLRTELLRYSLDFLKDQFSVEGENSVNVAEKIAVKYIDLAFNYPNLYKYFYLSDHEGQRMDELARSLRFVSYQKLTDLLMREHQISQENAKLYIMNLQMYVHGISSFIVAKVIFCGRDEIIEMIRRANHSFLMQATEKTQEESTT